MPDAWSLFMSLFAITLGVAMLLYRKKAADDQIKNHEKYMRGGKPASPLEVRVSNYSIVAGGVFSILIGFALLVSTILVH